MHRYLIHMSYEEKTFEVSMKRENGFEFRVDFGDPGIENLIMDEPEPVGENKGPNASKVLAAAMGNCLSASLLFCLQKARAEVGEVETRVEGKMRRNEDGRWRIKEVSVEISPEIDREEYESKFDRCMDLFEDFCVVSQSIEEGIPINVNVNPR
ncbi:OsmC family peroxiredoxin [Candidatus Bathyarchaeota archaeon]|nr:OsmC family peroxiredoxin [Candidatus Bathyarchaeota archaeon]